MSDSERSGVVDRNCRVHGVSNLFVVGSSVFPTGRRSNPTLTIVAMCIRLADHHAVANQSGGDALVKPIRPTSRAGEYNRSAAVALGVAARSLCAEGARKPPVTPLPLRVIHA
jgi:choline dehydrogenase-like flavoprotein